MSIYSNIPFFINYAEMELNKPKAAKFTKRIYNKALNDKNYITEPFYKVITPFIIELI